MNCWIFNQYINTPDMPGGSRHYELAKVLVRKGHRIVLIGANLKKQGKWYYYEQREGVSILWFNIGKYYGKSVKRLMNMLYYTLLVFCVPYIAIRTSQITRRPDVIIGSSVHLFGAYAAYILSCFLRVPFVFEVRDLWPQTLVDMKVLSDNSPLAKAMQFIEKQLFEKSVYIVSLLPFASDYICKRYNVDRDKVKWIPNGVNLDMFPEQDFPVSGFTISYLGAHGVANALGTIIDAADILNTEGVNDFTIQFVGEGPLKESLIKKARTRKLHNIKFYCQVPKNQVYLIAKSTDVFIVNLKKIPLYKYGISLNKIYDAMAMARPIIIACSARNNPVLEANAGICVGADDPEDLARSIKEMKKMTRAELMILGKNARNYVETYNEYRVLGDRLEAVLNNALSKYSKS